jgi:hypothetical protein
MRSVIIFFKTGGEKSFTEGKEHVTKIMPIELDNFYPVVLIQLDNGNSQAYYGMSYIMTIKNDIPAKPITTSNDSKGTERK